MSGITLARWKLQAMKHLRTVYAHGGMLVPEQRAVHVIIIFVTVSILPLALVDSSVCACQLMGLERAFAL